MKEKLDLAFRYPLIPLRGIYMFPHMVTHFDIGREKSVAALEMALSKDEKVFLVTQKDASVEKPTKKDLYDIGVIATIRQTLKLPGGTTRVLVDAHERATLGKLNTRKKYYEAEGVRLPDVRMSVENSDIEAAMRLVMNGVEEYAQYNSSMGTEMLFTLTEVKEPGTLADMIASAINVKEDDYYTLIKEIDEFERLIQLHEVLRREIELLKIENQIQKRVQTQMDQVQKEYYLKEQIAAIRKELGEDEESDSFIAEYEEQLDALKLEKDTREKIAKEITRLKQLNPQSPEFQVSRSYLDVIFDLPWNKSSKGAINLEKAERILDEDHYGLKDVKERIVEYIAIKKLTKTMKSPILCLVGPPGVGKTSIGRSIARSVGREFVRMSLGGVRDEAEIRGHRKTYIGAMPGRILHLLTQAGTNNPVFLLDEIDKLASDYRGDPASALLEVLDPEQNKTFTDHYAEVPFDLSQVLFVTTANYLEEIPEPLQDRMEIIRLSGYTHEEKFNIAKKHLLPKSIKDHGLAKADFTIDDEALQDIILYYTREAGVRSLERAIARALRKAAKRYAEDKKATIHITRENLTEWLGRKRYLDDDRVKEPEVGVVTGLAWTSVGGEILSIEVSTMEGSGKLNLTGSLGDVMKESASAALSYVRSRAKEFNLEKDFHKNLDIHIHVPEGATPKDGPSAGVTLAVALVSALTGQKVRPDIAMTGEITLRGKVLPIGGVKEKVLAAHRYQIPTLFLPAENEKDLEDVPEDIQKDFEFHFVSHISEILEKAFVK